MKKKKIKGKIYWGALLLYLLIWGSFLYSIIVFILSGVQEQNHTLQLFLGFALMIVFYILMSLLETFFPKETTYYTEHKDNYAFSGDAFYDVHLFFLSLFSRRKKQELESQKN